MQFGSMTILAVILAWFALFVGYVIWLRVRENARAGKPLWDFRPFNFLAASLLISLVVWLVIFIVRPEPQLTSADDKVKYGTSTHQPLIVNEGLWEKLDSFPGNIDLHYEILYNHYSLAGSTIKPRDQERYNAEEEKLYTYYSDLSRSADSHLHDIGHVMLAYMLISQPTPDYTEASVHLHLVDDPTTKYVNYVAGKIVLFGAGSSMAEEHFYSEIRNKGYKKGAYEYLAVLYDISGNDSALKRIVYSGAAEFIPPDIRAHAYYSEKDVVRFYQLKLQTMFHGSSAWGLSGGIAILFTWLFFLWSLTFMSRISFGKLMITVVIGGVLAMVSWWLYAFYKHGLGFWMNGDIGNDIVFSFTGIGFIEELVKIVPFLIILQFTRLIKKPVDYMVVASACGLGFAVFENLLYISNYGLDVIHSRALTSSVSHMACSGIVAYGFVLQTYRWPSRWWLIPVFFILASAAHGFYDFWLLNEKVRSFGILTLFFFLSEILVYISFINNALNQSVDSNTDAAALHFDSRRLTSVLAGSFILLFTFEYLAICLVYGTSYGNSSMLSAFLSGGYLVFFLSVRMSQIKIEPGAWNPVDVLSGILPSRMFGNRDEDTGAA